MALRLEKSRDPITGRAPDQTAVHLPSPTACRTQGRPERGLPGHAGSGTLVIVEMKRVVWDSLPQRDKLHSALPGSSGFGHRAQQSFRPRPGLSRDPDPLLSPGTLYPATEFSKPETRVLGQASVSPSSAILKQAFQSVQFCLLLLPAPEF